MSEKPLIILGKNSVLDVQVDFKHASESELLQNTSNYWHDVEHVLEMC